jgi:hypothetical protein
MSYVRVNRQPVLASAGIERSWLSPCPIDVETGSA